MKKGFIAGAFDLIHPGYIDMFRSIKEDCDYLIVGLHLDPSIEREMKLKPILSEYDRKKILLSIRYIDEVITYKYESDLKKILTENFIDVRFLGEDYIDKDFTGKELQIPIKWINRDHGWSTTLLKQKIYNSLK